MRAAAREETVLAPPVAERLVTRARLPAAEALTRPRAGGARAGGRRAVERRGRPGAAIGEATVKTHLIRVFEKLGVSDRTAAVTRAISRGLLPPP